MENPTPNGKARLAAVFGAAALAIPGGMLVSNAFANDGATDSGPATAPIQQSDENPYAPAQGERPDRDGRDCPEKDGAGPARGGSGESTAPAPSTGYDSQATAL